MKIASVMRKKRMKLPTTIPEIASALWLGVKLVKPANLKSFQFHNKRIYVGKQNENVTLRKETTQQTKQTATVFQQLQQNS